MYAATNKSAKRKSSLAVVAISLALVLAVALPVHAGKKKNSKDDQKEKPLWARIDFSKIVWPNPPAITRLKYLDVFSAEKLETDNTQKSSWMDRLSGVATGETRKNKPHYQLMQPYGLAVDSKGLLYVADGKVGAIFIFNPETRDVDMIKNGVHAHFQLVSGLAIDDTDRLFASDSKLNHVLVFDKNHRVEASINEGMASPAGLAIDNENRLLYVCDSDLDQVLVYDADAPYKLLRKMGKYNDKKHELTSPGDFARPTNVAVDDDGNVYVSDTFNDRVEIFDADGNFIRTFGKAGDGPGYFARPKGIAIDNDGHVWVADGVQNRVQVFTPEGKLLLYLGGTGLLPGQFSALAGLTVDKNNRVFTSEQYMGRVQMFRYVTDEEALAEKARRDAEQEKKHGKAASTTAAKEQDKNATGKAE